MRLDNTSHAEDSTLTEAEDEGGTPKPGPPDSDIRAQAAAYRDALAWAISTMQGLSRFGDPLWHALINAEGHAARALLADPQPEEETP